MKLVSVNEMIAVEREANARGLTYQMMMENAGRGLAEIILDRFGYLEEEGIVGLVGSGNNGGDTLVALTHLSAQGWTASAYLIRPRPQDDPLVANFKKQGGQVYHFTEDESLDKIRSLLQENSIVVDGILGTGFRLPLKPELAQIMKSIKNLIFAQEESPIVIAVDCPSGVDCDNGEAALETIPANLTVTMAAVKQGLLKFPAYSLVGDLTLVSIGLPEDGSLTSWETLTNIIPEKEWIAERIPERPLNAHKGTFGTLLVVAGSQNYTGAAWLAGQAAYRIGTGLVTLAIPASLHAPLAGQFPEATWLLLPEEEGFIHDDASEIIQDNLERVTTLLLGPGLGLHSSTSDFVKRLFGEKVQSRLGFFESNQSAELQRRKNLPPMIIDADGLKLLARIASWPEILPPQSILTPHPGEMSILTGLPVAEIQENRLEIARHFSQAWGHVVVLKGAFTIIASPDDKAAIIPVATPALARAGTGDVLAGLIAGLRAQKVEAFNSAVIGAWIHAQAGLRAAQATGNSASVLAGDVLNQCVSIISEIS